MFHLPLCTEISQMSWRHENSVLWLSEMRALLNLADNKSIKDPELYVHGLKTYCTTLMKYPTEINARGTRPLVRFFQLLDSKKHVLFSKRYTSSRIWLDQANALSFFLSGSSQGMDLWAGTLVEHPWCPIALLGRCEKYKDRLGDDPNETLAYHLLSAVNLAIVERSYQPLLDAPVLHGAWQMLALGDDARLARAIEALARALPSSIGAAMEHVYDGFDDSMTPAMDCSTAQMDLSQTPPEMQAVLMRALLRWHQEQSPAWKCVEKKHPRFSQVLMVHAALGGVSDASTLQALTHSWQECLVAPLHAEQTQPTLPLPDLEIEL